MYLSLRQCVSAEIQSLWIMLWVVRCSMQWQSQFINAPLPEAWTREKSRGSTGRQATDSLFLTVLLQAGCEVFSKNNRKPPRKSSWMYLWRLKRSYRSLRWIKDLFSFRSIIEQFWAKPMFNPFRFVKNSFKVDIMVRCTITVASTKIRC